MSSTLVARVAVIAPLNKLLSYRVPAEFADEVAVGTRIRVPLGRRTAIGFVFAVEQATDGVSELKSILEVTDPEPFFTSALATLLQRSADYYCYPIGEAVRTALPAGTTRKDADLAMQRERVFSAVPQSSPVSLRGKRQQEIWSFIEQQGSVPLSRLREAFPAPHAPLQRLVELGVVTERSEERPRDPFFALPVVADQPPSLNQAQQVAVDSLSAGLTEGGFHASLLHGVTGSGKTEVYLRVIAKAMELGRQVLVLVPEIALTPQLVGRFRARFSPAGKRIAVLHSALSDGERLDAWRLIMRSEVDVVIGVRSAVFAPLPKLGVIVVDEEHEGSYKQSDGFRYHARDLALLRGQLEGAMVVLGSATPALNTFYRAREGLCGHLSLPERVQSRPLPNVELIDLKESAGQGSLSPALATALQETLERGEQSLLLLNRRGFAPFLLCQDCGAVWRCPNCEISLTYHQGKRELRCHYCDYVLRPPEICDRCGGSNLVPEGVGTERLEEELRELLPSARILRMDRDTTQRKGAHQALLEQVEKGEVDILVGTQMVAKGHDFPGVTLVGVINADASLNFPDFRSAERTYALLSQVAGRAGRGDKPGKVLIQTFDPEHYVLQCVVNHDYLGFYEEEVVGRQMLGYPPFGFLANLVLAGNNANQVEQAAASLVQQLSGRSQRVEILGPAPCTLARLRGKSRWQILLKAPERRFLRALLPLVSDTIQTLPAGVRVVMDVDPLDML